jgi:hypothetical protein
VWSLSVEEAFTGNGSVPDTVLLQKLLLYGNSVCTSRDRTILNENWRVCPVVHSIAFYEVFLYGILWCLMSCNLYLFRYCYYMIIYMFAEPHNLHIISLDVSLSLNDV